MSTASSSGDLGDLVVGVLGVLASIPGKHTVYLRDDGRTKGIVKREHLVRPLIESQPYIEKCKVWKSEQIQWGSEKFRNGHHNISATLMSAHASHAKAVGVIDQIPTGEKAWLTVEPVKGFEERIIINRSPRYNNSLFPWAEIVKKYGKALLFVGLPEEHYFLTTAFGDVEYRKTKDMLEVAQMIAGSRLFIGNQSVAMTLAEGMKHPRIQETCLTIADCIYPGNTGAQYVADGSAVLPSFDDTFPTRLPSCAFDWTQACTLYIPKGGWQYDSPETGYLMTSNVSTCAQKVRSKLKGTVTQAEAEKMVLAQNVMRQPRHFLRNFPTAQFSIVHRALLNAGITDHPIISLMKGDVTFTV